MESYKMLSQNTKGVKRGANKKKEQITRPISGKHQQIWEILIQMYQESS